MDITLYNTLLFYYCRSVVDTIDDDTMLFVIGDHGMTKTGELEYCNVIILSASVCTHICSSVTLYNGFFMYCPKY